jgi:betaine-aldehyde dehydrogenase
MISFTGGTETGQKVMRLASSTTKKLSLELGGKSPNIVFSECDLDTAVGGTLSAIFMNQGQMCTAGSRLLLEGRVYDEFLKRLIERAKSLVIGPALDYQTQFGPVISREHRDAILNMIASAVSQGAKVECGGKIPADENLRKGFYIEPTILSNINNSMRIAQEEIFGPVLCVMKFQTEDEAIKIANDSQFGLASMIWTKDLAKADRVARQLQAGTVWINTYGGFYNEASFGGYKQSGFGRALGVEGLLEYAQSKHICTDQTSGGKPLVTNWF